jgi:hypothetical protein
MPVCCQRNLGWRLTSKTANALGLVVPASMQLLADEIIE